MRALKRTEFRTINGARKSTNRGSVGGAYLVFLLLPFLPLVAAALIMFGIWHMISAEVFTLIGVGTGLAMLFAWAFAPILQFKTASYFVNHSYYGQGRFKAQLSKKSFYRIHLMFTLLVIGLVAMNMVLAALFMMQGFDFLAAASYLGVLVYAQILLFSILIRAFLKAEISNYVSSQTVLENAVKFNANLSARELFKVYFVNILLLIVTLGLARPWTIIRLQKYLTDHYQAYENGNLAVFVAQQEQAKSSLGEEVGEAFDLDIALPV